MCRWILSWVLLTSLVTAISEEQQYCAVRYRRLCQGKGHHVACQFPDAGPGPSCERYTPIKFTNDLKHFITHYLNRRRQRIAAGNERVRGGVHLPKPQVMMLVEWDRELALLAQRLADQCYFVHDDCRATVRYPYAGQTVGEVRWRRSSESDELSAQRAIRRVLDAWWGERRRVQSKQLTAPFRLTSKGNVWGHFSQLAVWNLQAVGCGAVRHGARHSRLLLVCDFSHTNMLGQRTLVPGSTAPCPIHTVRKSRTAYPLLCAPVRRSVPSGSQEFGIEDNFEEDEEDDNAITTDVGDLSSSELWYSSSGTIACHSSLVKSKTTREFIDEPRNIDNEIYQEFPTAPTTLIEAVVLKLDQDLEEKTRSKVHNMNVNYKQAHNTFEINQFENVVRNDWKARKKPHVGQWRDNNHQENLEEVIPLTIPPREITETVDPTAAEVYRPKEDEPRTAEEVYRPTIREGSAHDESYFRPRWRQTRIRPQRPGANALLISTSTATHATATKKEFIQVSLNLDKEDIDQLFRDTGFNVHWRKHTT
ncbi:hypothetical protein PYW07_010185 [Mythimna separata]|uniref:SCP domain-containing protein n=1 Tax=Mythimna separata TaxID=271217 RepID=A0AAD7YI67_MYTSE|nr:hypothetical protein PYW07_010185 [Mythimna separata]